MRYLASLSFALVMGAVSVSAFAGDPVAGEKVYSENACPTCHGVGGVPVFPGAPSFQMGERMEKSDAELAQGIAEGSQIMPAWKDILSNKQISDVIAYVRTLQK